jgi:hypothetical protein
MQLTLPLAYYPRQSSGQLQVENGFLVQKLISILAEDINSLPAVQAFGTFVPE